MEPYQNYQKQRYQSAYFACGAARRTTRNFSTPKPTQIVARDFFFFYPNVLRWCWCWCGILHVCPDCPPVEATGVPCAKPSCVSRAAIFSYFRKFWPTLLRLVRSSPRKTPLNANLNAHPHKVAGFTRGRALVGNYQN